MFDKMTSFFERVPAFTPNRDEGTVVDRFGVRSAVATPQFLRSLRYVLERSRIGSWDAVLKEAGRAAGKAACAAIDARLGSQQQPLLGAQPLETALQFLPRHFAACGWGQVTLDLSLAPQHGLVLAYLDHSYVSDVLPDANGCVDAHATGALQGFFEYISGDTLDCAEIACERRGTLRSTFVVATAERLRPVLPLVGREPAETIVARLKG
jgi:hypothetical protein